MKKAVNLFVVAVAAFGLTGCATIVSGTTQKLNVTSQPSGADAKADNNMTSKTPATFTLDRKSDHAIEISKDGYKTTTVLIKRAMNGMGFGNVLIGGIVGIGVDAVSGANNKLVPERVDVALEQGSGYSESPKFMAQVDQDFYDKNILKPSQDKARKEEVKKQESVKPEVAAATNFSSKTPSIVPAKV